MVVVVPVVLAAVRVAGGYLVAGALEVPERIHVYLAAEPDERLHRIVWVVPRAGPVLGTLIGVVQVCIDGDAVGDGGATLERQPDAVHCVPRRDPLDLRVGEGQPDVGAFAGPGDGHVRVQRAPGLEEVPDVVGMGNPRHLGTGELVDQPPVEFGTPTLVHVVVKAIAVAVDKVKLPVNPLAVFVLVVRHPEDGLSGVADVRRHSQPGARGATTGLGGDLDDAAGRPRAVKGRGRRALEYADVLDVRRIEVIHRVAVVDTTPAAVPPTGVAERDPVHDKEGLVLARKRTRAPDHDPRGTPGGAGVSDVDTRHVALEGVDDVVLGHLRQHVALDVLLRIAEGLLLPLEAKSGDRDAFDADGHLGHMDLHPIGGGHHRFLDLVPQIGHDQSVGISGHAEGEESFVVRRRGDLGSFYGDPNARKRSHVHRPPRHVPGHGALLGTHR